MEDGGLEVGAVVAVEVARRDERRVEVRARAARLGRGDGRVLVVREREGERLGEPDEEQREQAIRALEEADGEPAEAIVKLLEEDSDST